VVRIDHLSSTDTFSFFLLLYTEQIEND